MVKVIIKGNHTLMCGDNLDTQVLEMLPNDFDIVFTSPPYNLGGNNYLQAEQGTGKQPKWNKENIEKNNKYTSGYNDNNKNWGDWMIRLIRTYLDKAEYVFFNVQSLGANKKDINRILFELEDYYCDTIIWNKGNGIPNGFNERVMTASFEYIHIFGREGNKSVGTKPWKGTIKNVIELFGNQRNEYSKVHKALFPEQLAEWIVDNFVKEGGKVLDPFGGLFTTSIASQRHNIHSTCIEIDERYFEEGVKRVQKEVDRPKQLGFDL